MKIKKILLTLVLMLIFTTNVYADNTVTRLDNIYSTTNVSGKNPVYITNLSNPIITINDSNNFKVIDINDPTSDTRYKGDKQKVIVLKTKPTADVTYTNPYSITFQNAGYYIDSKGQAIYLDIMITNTESFIKYAGEISTYYEMATVGPNYLWIESFEINDAGSRGSSNSLHPGRHDKISVQLLSNGKALSSSVANSLSLQWLMSDIDVRDYTISSNQYSSSATYRETLKFTTGFDSKFYVRTNSVLEISDNNTKYTATEATDNDNGQTGQKGHEYSTVVAYQTSNKSTIEWWGSNAGTEFFPLNYSNPVAPAPTKAVDKKYKKVGENVTYTVSQFFPITISENAPKSIVLTDEFDKKLDISNIQYQVLNEEGTDVSTSWKKEVSGQKVTLTYNGSNIIEVGGNYKFKFSKIKVLEPDSTYETVTEENIIYRSIPNKATVTITPKTGSATPKQTNVVNVLVTGEGAIKLTKEVIEGPKKNPKVGDLIKYKLIIKNTGKTELTNLELTDNLNGFVFEDKYTSTKSNSTNKVTINFDTSINSIKSLAVGEEITVYGQYALTKNDIVNGKTINNSAIVTAKDPNGNPVQDIDDVNVEIIVNPQTGMNSKIILVIEIAIIMLTLSLFLVNKYKNNKKDIGDNK